MARKTLASVILFLSSILATSLASALSLGELSLDSRLNQPFRATVPIRHAGDLNSSQVNVKLASRSDFDKAGVDYAYFLNNLKFEVELKGDSSGRVIITTREPIVEPYLNFLVEARWPTGRMLREYVVLLDPPATPAGETATVETARGGVASQAAEGRPAPRERVVERREEPAPTTGPRPRAGAERTELPAATEPGTYRVQHNDTLWEVAVRARPSESVSVQQTMLALLRNNPNAFIENNVNRLKSGYVLRLPTEEEAGQLPQDQAVAEVSRQNAVWRGEAPPAAEPATGPQLKTGEAAEEAAPEGAGETARLSIATPGDSDAGEGAGGESAAALRDQLAAAEENLDKAQRENEEMQSRVRDLEEQMATLQRLLEVRDEQLSALQDAAQTGEEAPKPAQPAPPAQEEGADDLLGGDNRLLINIGLGLAILLLLAALMFYQRRRRQQAEQSVPLDRMRTFGGGREEDESPAVAAATAASAYAATRTEAEVEEESEAADVEARERFFGDEEEPDEYSTDNLLGEEEWGKSTLRAEPVEAETGDAIAEAEIYVAYGRYDQAAEMLKSAISREPERSDLRVKLLEIYLDTHDRENFLREFEALEALGDDDAVSRVKESMSAIEGVSDWLRPDEAAGTAVETDEESPREAPGEEFDETGIADKPGDKEEESLEFDLDLSGDSDLGEFDFDFETDDTLDTKSGPPASEAPEAKDEEGLDFDLDVDLDNEEEDKLGTASLDKEPAPASYSLDESLESLDEELRSTDLEDLDFDLDELEDESELPSGGEPEAERRQAPEAEPEPTTGAESTSESESDEGIAFEMPGEETAQPEEESTFAGFDEQLEGAGAEEEMDDFGLLGDSDEVSTKLDLARAYIDMGDTDGAREMLQEVVQEGDDSQKQEANALLERL